jgi:hypothetical protein
MAPLRVGQTAAQEPVSQLQLTLTLTTTVDVELVAVTGATLSEALRRRVIRTG